MRPWRAPMTPTTPKTALQGSVRSRAPKGKTKPAARPLAKRAYAYVDRLRGASKYLDADDNARLVEEASIDPSSCADDEHVGNRHGALICEKKPEVDAPALPRGDEL